MRTNPVIASALAAGLLAGSASIALSQGTATTPGAATAEVDNNDDGFDLGWLGLLGLLGLAGLKKRKNDHVVVRDNVGRPHV